MEWFQIVAAEILEILWAVSLKYSDGFSKLLPSAITLLAMAASFVFLALASKKLPIGTAYAVWTGIGASGTAILGILLFHEPLNFFKVLFLLMIIGGTAGLKLTA